MYKNRLALSINNYFKFIDSYKNRFKMIIYGPIASQKDSWHQNAQYPRAGTEVQRNKATFIYNCLLRKGCETRNIFFFTLYDTLVNDSFHTREEYIADQCHLSNKLYNYAMQRFDSEMKIFYGL